MKITAIEIENVRGFQHVEKTVLSSSINIFIGANNSGKSTILNSIFLLQRASLGGTDITIGKSDSTIRLFYKGKHLPTINESHPSGGLIFNLANNSRHYFDRNRNLGATFNQIPSQEPHNLIYPYLSKRKAVSYADAINESTVNSVEGNFIYLYSKIDRLITPQFQPGNLEYVEACKNVLGFEVSTLAKGNGKQAVYFVHNAEHIPLTAMGEGVANILGLITDLCVASDKIFLIEEPENDIHPKALKALLKLIIDKSSSNQFFISTHSNIVMKYLGGIEGSKIFNISNELRDIEREKLFISEVREVSDEPEERRKILEDLGYDFFDFDLWKGWLFLEESSAEVLIRDYFIDWFVKSLKGKIRTFSAGGTSSIIPKFEDFNRLFVFLHLEPTYKNKVWVVIDKGEIEDQVIQEMRNKYLKSGWDSAAFDQFSEHDFEKYYPKRFQEKVDLILLISEKAKKRQAKKELLDEVLNWINENEKLAIEEFKESANEVIQKLKVINKEMNK